MENYCDLQSYMISPDWKEKKKRDQILCESVGVSYLLPKSAKGWAGTGAHLFCMMPFSLDCSPRYSKGMVSVRISVLTTNTYSGFLSCRGPDVVPES